LAGRESSGDLADQSRANKSRIEEESGAPTGHRLVRNSSGGGKKKKLTNGFAREGVAGERADHQKKKELKSLSLEINRRLKNPRAEVTIGRGGVRTYGAQDAEEFSREIFA